MENKQKTNEINSMNHLNNIQEIGEVITLTLGFSNQGQMEWNNRPNLKPL